MCMYSVPHKELCLCCFLTVCDHLKTINLESFDVLLSNSLRRRQGKTQLSYASQRQRYKNYLHSASVVPNLCLSIDRRFSFLKNVSLFPK